MGRPREFDDKKVTDKIMLLFWERGFNGTSMDELVKISGLNKGSLYTCFGNKKDLFKLALNHYFSKGSATFVTKGSPIKTLCQFYSRIVLESDLPKKERRGCFIFNSCLEFGNKNDSLTSFILSIEKQRELLFENLLNDAKEKGEISKSIDTKRASRRAYATAFTIREMCKFKPEKEFLTDIANSFLETIGANDRVLL